MAELSIPSTELQQSEEQAEEPMALCRPTCLSRTMSPAGPEPVPARCRRSCGSRDPPRRGRAPAQRARSEGSLLPATIIAGESQRAAGGAPPEEILSLSPPLRRCHVLGTGWELPSLPSLSPSETGAAPRLPLPLG